MLTSPYTGYRARVIRADRPRTGQSVGPIGDFPGAGDLVASIVVEARDVLSGLDRPRPA